MPKLAVPKQRIKLVRQRLLGRRHRRRVGRCHRRFQLAQKGNHWLAEADGIEVQLRGAPLRTVGDLAIGFRPSAIRISGNGRWTVKELRDFGWTRTVRLACATEEIIAEDTESSLQPGNSAKVEIDSHAVFLFDLEKGDRLL